MALLSIPRTGHVPRNSPHGATAPSRALGLGVPGRGQGTAVQLASTPPPVHGVTAAPLPQHALFMLEPLA